MKLVAHRVDLRTKRAFTISAGTTTSFGAILVELEHDGVVAYGEASPSSRVTGETIESVESFLAWVAREIPSEPGALLGFLREMHGDAAHDAGGAFAAGGVCGNPSARAAVDLAVHDLLGKRAGVPAHRLHDLREGRIETSLTVSLAPPEVMAAEAREYAAGGVGVLKLKLGPAANAVAQVEAVRAAVPKARIFCDANQAWTVPEARVLAPALVDLGVAFLEQPVRATDRAGLAELSRDLPLPVVADEAIHDAFDVERLLDLDYRGGINVKLQKAGGILPAMRALRLARRSGLSTMCGCNLETSVGIAGALQLLDLLDEADLDGNLLLANDPFATAAPVDGWLETPVAPGLGVHPTSGWPPNRRGEAADQV